MQFIHEMQTRGMDASQTASEQERVGWEWGPAVEGLIVAHEAPSDFLVLVGVVARDIKVLPDLIIENKGGTEYQTLGFGF